MSRDTFHARIGSQEVDLPVVEVGGGNRIALMITVDLGVRFLSTAGRELAELLAPARPEIVATVATLGIPVGMEATRSLGLDDYLVLQKSRKWHLRTSPSVALTSVTTQDPQRLILDEHRIGTIAGRRVAFVDDVISTGASVLAGVGLLEAHGAEIVAIGGLLTEGDAWRTALGDKSSLVRSLGEIPFPVP